MQPILLTFNVHEEKAKKLLLLSMQYKVRVQSVSKEEFGSSIGSILENNTKEVTDTHITFDDEMVVFAHFSQALLQSYLKSWRAMGIESIPLKAMLTPTNVKWTPIALHQELLEEAQWFKENKAPMHNEAN